MKSFCFLAFLFICSTLAFGQSPCSDGKISLNPTSLDFGSVRIGNSAKLTFQIHNGSTGGMGVTAITSPTSQFVVVSPPAFPFCVAAGGAQTITVAFVPAQTGSISAGIGIQSTGGSAVLRVMGTGSPAGKSDIVVSPLSVNLGDLPVGTFKQFRLHISNMGNVLLQVQPFAFDPCVRTIPSGPYAISHGRTITVRVRLIACNAGAVTGMLNVRSDDPDEPSIMVQMMGNGTMSGTGFVDRTMMAHFGSFMAHATGSQWTDINGDGMPDLFVTGMMGNMLFLNRGNGMFANRTKRSRLGLSGMDVRGASWADIDNDGDLDLFVAESTGHSSIYKNTMEGVFSMVGSALRSSTERAEQQSSNAGIWFDFNKDGLIDLFVVRDGAANSLYKNIGLLRFVDVASTAGVQFQGAGRSAVAADFNGDGYDDLYVVNSQQPNKLYLNLKNGTFKDASAGSGANLSDSFTQAIAADYDGDQDLDLFVINHEGPCALLKNNGKAKFQNVTGIANLGLAKNATSATFEDFDGDGHEDLIVLGNNAKNLIFLNNGLGKFKKVNKIDLNSAQTPSSISAADFNSDGIPDAFIGDASGQNNSLYERTGESKNWITIVLEGTASNRAAIGAKVVVHVGLLTEFKVVSGGNGQNQGSLPLEFGLGTATTIDSIQIVWPSGVMQMLANVPANQILRVKEGAP